MFRAASVLILVYLAMLRAEAQPIDTLSATMLNEVVVASERGKDPLLRTKAGIVTANAGFLKESAAANATDALENLRGVQLITAGLGFRIINTRGFANTTNVRLVQLVDGFDIQSPHIGAPAGFALMPNDLDVASAEVLPGMAATLFGVNAINGLVAIRTNDAFDKPGLSVQQKTGLNRFGGPGNQSPSLYSETAVRYAHIFSDRWAVKINYSNMSGKDWMANDHTDLNAGANVSTGLTGSANPGADPVSSYGNEGANRRSLLLGSRQYVVARTGYDEADVTSDKVSNQRADITISWRMKPGTTMSYVFRGAVLNSIYQRANRFRLEDYELQQHGFKVRSESLQVNLYMNSENTGNSYNLRSMAENIDRAFRNDNQWFGAYTTAFNQSSSDGLSAASAHLAARGAADEGRYIPGTSPFATKLRELQQINNWDEGAALKVRASFIQGDFQWTPQTRLAKRLTEKTGVEFWSGGEIRTYFIRPDGNYFINPDPAQQDNNLLYTKAGMFAAAERRWMGDRLTVQGALRADRNDYFPVAWNPRLSMIFAPDKHNILRASFQSGYRFPVIFEAFSNVNSGGVKRVGGLKIMSSGIFENAWLQSSISDFQRAVLSDINSGTYTKAQAIERQQQLLKKNTYTYLNPEQVSAAEIGYRRSNPANDWEWEADAHISRYEDFIGQVNLNVPNTLNPDSLGIALNEKSLQRPYRMWTNSTGRVTIAGAGFNGRVRFSPSATLHGNITWNRLFRQDRQDGLEDGFNTPPWVINLSAVRYNRSQTFFTTITARWQAGYYWQSFLVSGDVPSYATMDAAINFSPPESRLNWKAGASNLFNRYYRSYLGGPDIGGFYYISVTYRTRH